MATSASVSVSIINKALCQARHDMPECVTGSIFDTTVNPLDIDGLSVHALNVLTPYLNANPLHLNLYVTGLTVALVAVLNACKHLNIKVTLYHFNRDTNSYYPQEIW